MALKLTRHFLFLVLLIVPLSTWADSNLDYQNRGDRFEGIRPKPVSGYDIELISVLVDYQEPTTQLPDQLRIAFHLQSQTAVQLDHPGTGLPAVLLARQDQTDEAVAGELHQ